ncbi:cell division protein FtsB [Billgrantia gudaonensis]|uniref:Cell division protein FtsB n=1 Tax=Billgrantia gudaonensis TaxID=376427 RepID=A0A1G8UGX7_9GAMM|nr:cell division protein FtsB [Halomonas gudaonensis]SDJ52988.1 cell division protein FtsB [Halomonas gudaonensis]
MLKWLAIALALLLTVLQYRLWLGDGGLRELSQIRERVETLDAENEPLRARNERLAAEVVDLKTGLDAIEERARSDIGMVRRDERFYWVPGVAVQTDALERHATALMEEAPRASGASDE